MPLNRAPVRSFTCLFIPSTPKTVQPMSQLQVWPLHDHTEENTYYIEIYMNIDIDGYDFTIFLYRFESFTQEICVRLWGFAYRHLCTDNSDSY